MSKKKVFIGVGHGGSDPGAVGYLVEKDINLTMATACCNFLTAYGVDVKMSRTKDEDDTVNQEVAECNAYAPDLAIDVHNNSGGGDGFEVFHTIHGGTGKTLAQNIEKHVKAMGQNSRGVKTRQGTSGDYYAFIRETVAPAVICEGVFVDTKADAAQADTLAEQQAFGVAYAKGILDSYPFELSGGMQQRVGIAAAMLPEPEILLADEPTSALDVYIQKQVVEELLMIRREYGTSMILVTHNLAVARRMADRMLIMKDGQIVEQGSVAQIFAHPACAYTRQLLAAVPELRR